MGKKLQQLKITDSVPLLTVFTQNFSFKIEHWNINENS